MIPLGSSGAGEARKMDRFVQFAMAAADEAIKGANLTINESNRDRVGILIGTGIGGISTMLDAYEVLKEPWPRSRQFISHPHDDPA